MNSYAVTTGSTGPSPRFTSRVCGQRETGLTTTRLYKLTRSIGSAPIYKETAVPIALRRDSGLQYVDQNAARLPQYPFEVVFHAAEIMNPKIKFDAIDVLINRNSLRKFLSFCQGRSQDSFRVNLFTVSNTLIVERCTRTATEMLHGALNPGYGHVFERAVTEIPADLQDSTAHHRVLRYNLGGLECAVRFEVDASVVHCSADSQAEEARDPNAAIQEGVDSLIGGLNDMSLHKEGCASKHGSVTVIPLGAGTAQECTVEIKANSQSPAKAVPQMWFGQTPYLVRGHHSGNTFTRVTFDDMRPHFQRWESSAHNQAALQKMVLLLGQLRDVVKATGNKSCVAIYEKAPGQPIVRVFLSTVERKPLPDSVIGKFWETKP